VVSGSGVGGSAGGVAGVGRLVGPWRSSAGAGPSGPPGPSPPPGPVARIWVIVHRPRGREGLVELLAHRVAGRRTAAPAAVRAARAGPRPGCPRRRFSQPALPRRVGHRGPRDDQVGPQPVHPERGAHRRHLAQRGVRQHHPRAASAAPPRSARPARFRPPASGPETLGVRVVVQSRRTTSARGPGSSRRGRLDGQPEPVQELRAAVPPPPGHGATSRNRAACRTDTPSRSTS